LTVTALRSFFRYLRHRGDISSGLAACDLPAASRQYSSLPKSLQPQQIQQVLLSGCLLLFLQFVEEVTKAARLRMREMILLAVVQVKA
jgi:hypothetical protein